MAGPARNAQRSRNARAAKMAAEHDAATASIITPGAAAKIAPLTAAIAAITIKLQPAARGALGEVRLQALQLAGRAPPDRRLLVAISKV